MEEISISYMIDDIVHTGWLLDSNKVNNQSIVLDISGHIYIIDNSMILHIGKEK